MVIPTESRHDNARHVRNGVCGLPLLRDVNTTIMEMLITVYACRTSCARSITGVLPYFPYSKQCKMRKRGSIVTKLIASMMCKAGEDSTKPPTPLIHGLALDGFLSRLHSCKIWMQQPCRFQQKTDTEFCWFFLHPTIHRKPPMRRWKIYTLVTSASASRGSWLALLLDACYCMPDL